VKPCGTGSPSPVISARLAPLPPRRFFIEAFPSLKRYTYFFDIYTTPSTFFKAFKPLSKFQPKNYTAFEIIAQHQLCMLFALDILFLQRLMKEYTNPHPIVLTDTFFGR
jgi:hypothetical protein